MKHPSRRGAQSSLPLVLGLLVLLAAGCRGPTGAGELVRVTDLGGDGPRILCIVAHPDDEIAFAGTLFKTATFLDGVCDLVTITNGEGGFKYSTLAEPWYGLELTEEEIGRRHLPSIRRRELTAGCRILGVRNLHFLGERDHRYTTDPNEVLGPNAEVWDVPRIRARLDAILRAGDYDFVFTLTPTEATHGHHQAATILALDALASFAPEERPVAFCVQTWSSDDEVGEEFSGREAWPRTRIAAGVGPYRFDRTQKFGYRERLDYRIVSNWAIAEHKSQGTMQLLVNRGDEERFFPFALTVPDDLTAIEEFFAALAAPQFEAKTYGPSAGTNTGVK